MDFEKEVETFCDNYCKFPEVCREQEELEEKCNNCPIVKLVERLEQALGPAKALSPSVTDRLMNTFLGGR